MVRASPLWQFVQQANVGYRIPIGAGLDVQAGLFLSPIGPEGMNIRDGWFYSRSDLFYGLPFYHTGLRVSYPLTDHLGVVVWVVNGWNTVLDNNSEKSIAAQLTFAIPDVLSASLVYFTGVERPEGAAERAVGRTAPWRHTFDLNATVTPIAWLALQAQVAGGFEPNAFGTSGYAAGALAVRVTPIDWLALSARGDFFWETVPPGASAIFWPVEWVSSATGSVELRPHSNILVPHRVPARPRERRCLLRGRGRHRRDHRQLHPQRSLARHSHARRDGVLRPRAMTSRSEMSSWTIWLRARRRS